MLNCCCMRAFLLAILSISLAVSRPILGCECGRAGPACAYVNAANAIFVGTVVFTDDDGSGRFAQETHVHFKVEEAFKGLAPGVQDVWVDPGSFTSCYADYHIGERLLVFGYRAGTMPVDTAAMTVTPKKGVKTKPLPPGIDPRHPPVVYSAPECSGTRGITPESEKLVAPEIEYLRRFKTGTSRPFVTGRVFQDQDFGIFDSPGLSGVKVAITGNHFRGSTETYADGRYSFEDVPPGRYTLNVALAAYTSRSGAIQLEVSGNGCGWADFDMIGSGVIEGQLLDHEGRPAPDVKVNILRLGADGKPVFYGFKEARSNSEGRYEFEKLPGGDFQIGVNLSSPPDVKTPYSSTTWSDNGQSRIHLNAGENKQLTPFNLPSATAIRRVSVRVLWPDGRAAKGVDVWAEVGDQPGNQGETDADGRTHLDLLQGIDYAVEAKIWVGTGAKRKVARSGVSRVNPGSEPIQLNLILDKRTSTYR
jgi:hypothetical protein